MAPRSERADGFEQVLSNLRNDAHVTPDLLQLTPVRSVAKRDKAPIASAIGACLDAVASAIGARGYR